MLPAHPDELHISSRETRLVSSLLKLNKRMQKLTEAAGEEEFKQWQSAWTKQSQRIESQLRLIQSQLETSSTAETAAFSVVGLHSSDDE